MLDLNYIRQNPDEVKAKLVDLNIEALAGLEADNPPYHAIFIRAPLIESVENGTQILGQLEDGRIVAAQQAHLLVTAFHPELTEDNRFHRYFVKLVESYDS